jgi:hypothetical protein
MSAKPAYRIDYEDRDIVFRVRSDLVDREEASKFLDYLVLESIRKQSRLSEEDADALAREVKLAAWERVRPLFEDE